METASLLNHGADQTKRSTYLQATAVTFVSSLNVQFTGQVERKSARCLSLMHKQIA